MKVKRQKRVSKILKYFHLNFGFRRPYNMIVGNGNLSLHALNSLDYLEQKQEPRGKCNYGELETEKIYNSLYLSYGLLH